LSTFDLNDRSGVEIGLISDGALPAADDRFCRDSPVKEHHGTDHDGTRYEEPKKDL
jgi:hypothetical protein